MRILEVTPGYYPTIGGVERHVEAISEQFVAMGHDVVVAAMDPLGEATSLRQVIERRNGVKVRHFPSFGPSDAYRLPRGMARFAREARRSFEVVHVHNYHAALIPLFAALQPRALVVTPHLNDAPHSRMAALLHAPYGVVGRWAMRRADAVVCVSAAERQRVVARLGVKTEKTFVIPNGIDARLLVSTGDNREYEPGLVVAVGRLQPYKRVEDAISALALLPKDYRLAVVGEGPHRGALADHARALGMADRVTFAGRAGESDLAGWYRRAQAVVNFSAAEAFGMTVLEALAFGCHVVCSDIPAFRDLALQFGPYVSIAGPTHRDRAAAIQSAMAAASRSPEPQQRADLSNFTWTVIAERLIQVFRRVADPNNVTEGSNLASSIVLTE